MRTAINISFLIIVFTAMSGCKQETLTPSSYVSWVRDSDNGLHVTRTIGDFEFEIQYTPPEYIVLQSERDRFIDNERMKTESERYSGTEQYVFKIHRADGQDILDDGDPEGYATRLEYFVSYAESDIWLIRGNDTLPCAQYTYERTYGLNPDLTVVVGFESDSSGSENDRTFLFDDHVLGIGPVKLNIEKTAFQQLPLLSYEK